METTSFVKLVEKSGFEIQKVEHLHFALMRLFLAYIKWPKWFTIINYRIGQFIMKILFSKLGDYKMIYAKKK